MNSIAPKIVVADSPANLAPTVATALAARALGAIADHGNFTLALSGGSTPQELYRYLAREAGAVALPWPQTDIFLVDERKVAYDHAASNYRAVRQLLLQQLTATPRSVQPLPITGGRNELAAYAIEMRRLTGTANNEIPQLDLVLLGMGVDGHTASTTKSRNLI